MKYVCSSEISAFVMTWIETKQNSTRFMIPENLLFLASVVGLDIGLLSTGRQTHEVCWGCLCQGIIVIQSMLLHHFISSLPLPAPLAHYHAQHQQCQQRTCTSDSMTDDSWWELPMVERDLYRDELKRQVAHIYHLKSPQIQTLQPLMSHKTTLQQAEVPPAAYLDFLEEEMVESSWPQWCYNFTFAASSMVMDGFLPGYTLICIYNI